MSKELIRKYLNGELSNEAADEVKRRMDEDLTFAEEMAAEVVNHAERARVKKKLEDIQNKQYAGKSQKTVPRAAAAVIVLLIVACGLFWIVTSEKGATDLHALYQTSFNAYPAISNTRGEPQEVWNKAMDAYRAKDYPSAIHWLDQSTYPAYIVHLYKGISLMAIEPINHDLAIKELETVLGSDNDYHEQARWYLALALLDKGRVTKCRAILEEVSLKKDHYQQQQAVGLMKDLEKD